ncbi:hypothetical protein M758_11G047100 [Ceratodon purpureus]|nr:hypothetical protein M758_11G047100 [Ceratodon purpureus]
MLSLPRVSNQGTSCKFSGSRQTRRIILQTLSQEGPSNSFPQAEGSSSNGASASRGLPAQVALESHQTRVAKTSATFLWEASTAGFTQIPGLPSNPPSFRSKAAFARLLQVESRLRAFGVV